MTISRKDIKFATVTALVVSSYVTFALISINMGFSEKFLFIWLRSWLMAFLLVFPSLLYVGPFIKRKLN